MYFNEVCTILIPTGISEFFIISRYIFSEKTKTSAVCDENAEDGVRVFDM